VNKLYGTSDIRLSTKLVPTFADRGCHVTNSYGRNVDFLGRTREGIYWQFNVQNFLESSAEKLLLKDAKMKGGFKIVPVPKEKLIALAVAFKIFLIAYSKI
jgi:hypothetical protein